jgi:hypothetical protein
MPASVTAGERARQRVTRHPVQLGYRPLAPALGPVVRLRQEAARERHACNTRPSAALLAMLDVAGEPPVDPCRSCNGGTLTPAARAPTPLRMPISGHACTGAGAVAATSQAPVCAARSTPGAARTAAATAPALAHSANGAT